MKWRFQFILLVLTMGCMIMGGIHLAEKGVQRVEGIQDGPAQSFHLTRLENGKMEMTVLGREYSLQNETILPVIQSVSSPLIAKEENNERNPWGNHIGNWITTFSQRLTNWLAHF